MNVADFEGDPRTESVLRYVVYGLIALGVGSCLLVGADRPADPILTDLPPTTVTPAPAPAPAPAPGSVAP